MRDENAPPLPLDPSYPHPNPHEPAYSLQSRTIADLAAGSVPPRPSHAPHPRRLRVSAPTGNPSDSAGLQKPHTARARRERQPRSPQRTTAADCRRSVPVRAHVCVDTAPARDDTNHDPLLMRLCVLRGRLPSALLRSSHLAEVAVITILCASGRRATPFLIDRSTRDILDDVLMTVIQHTAARRQDNKERLVTAGKAQESIRESEGAGDLRETWCRPPISPLRTPTPRFLSLPMAPHYHDQADSAFAIPTYDLCHGAAAFSVPIPPHQRWSWAASPPYHAQHDDNTPLRVHPIASYGVCTRTIPPSTSTPALAPYS
ncbi:hypothetical protein PLICRDRAFT_177074 [Plicaturopsis crispa FD-325 SS-3]|nr:hypothetical protein PLICRDRAFT_177074 [Plicaturopsis crispa FD-325 SS-3]